jgi:hypothetical protein
MLMAMFSMPIKPRTFVLMALTLCVTLAGCAAPGLVAYMDPEQLKTAKSQDLCTTLVNNDAIRAAGNIPIFNSTNFENEVARRSLACPDTSNQLHRVLKADVKYKEITPEIRGMILDDLKNGKLTLECGDMCGASWANAISSIHAVDLADNYQELAVRVMQIGHKEDLAYYYLGQAAQGLGFHQAAIGYYAMSAGIAGGPPDFAAQCVYRQSTCMGVDLPAVLPVLIQASKDAIARQNAAPSPQPSPQPPAPAKPKKKAPTPPPAPTNPPGWEAPPPVSN